jgi:hypothetical protein
MESPTYFLISCNKLEEPLYLLLLSGTFSNTSVGWIEFKGSGNNGPSIKASSNSFILCFNSKFYFSILSIDCFKYSLVALWNCAIFDGATPSKSIDDFHLSDDFLFLILTFSNNNFLDS